MHTHIHTLQPVFMHIHTCIPSPIDVVDTVKSHNHFALFQLLMFEDSKVEMEVEVIHSFFKNDYMRTEAVIVATK